MPKYRKKPIEVEAFQLNYEPGYDRPQAINANANPPEWLMDALVKPAGSEGQIYLHKNGLWVIHTLEGLHEVTPGDYIIKGIKGEIYPCKPDIFEASYDIVE